MAKQQDGYLSAKESRRISKENRRITDPVSYTHLTLPTTSRRQRQMCIRDSYGPVRKTAQAQECAGI